MPPWPSSPLITYSPTCAPMGVKADGQFNRGPRRSTHPSRRPARPAGLPGWPGAAGCAAARRRRAAPRPWRRLGSTFSASVAASREERTTVGSTERRRAVPWGSARRPPRTHDSTENRRARSPRRSLQCNRLGRSGSRRRAAARGLCGQGIGSTARLGYTCSRSSREHSLSPGPRHQAGAGARGGRRRGAARRPGGDPDAPGVQRRARARVRVEQDLARDLARLHGVGAVGLALLSAGLAWSLRGDED